LLSIVKVSVRVVVGVLFIERLWSSTSPMRASSNADLEQGCATRRWWEKLGRAPRQPHWYDATSASEGARRNYALNTAKDLTKEKAAEPSHLDAAEKTVARGRNAG